MFQGAKKTHYITRQWASGTKAQPASVSLLSSGWDYSGKTYQYFIE